MNCSNCQAEILDDSRFCSKCGTLTHSSPDEAEPVTQSILIGPAEQPSGTVLAGKYRVLEVVGRGGMGIVRKAEDLKLNRTVALKFLPQQMVRNPQARERFVLEARAAAGLQHPNICTIYEIHDEEETPFIAMEYIEGQTLRARIKEHPVEAGEAVEVAIQAAEALEEAHRKGIVHRDIKSANIMLTDKGQAKVMDFGLAKVRGESLHTREGTTLGTVAYMSPEQARGESVDQRSDIWSLGVVLYEMLSGHLPFTADRDASILYSIVHEEAKPLIEARPDLPSELHHIVNHALQKDRKARYAAAADMSADLRSHRDNLKAEELSVLTLRTFLRAVRKPRVALLAAVSVAVLCAAGAWFFHRQSKIRWAREQALPEIQRLELSREVGNSNLVKAYALVQEAGKYIPGDLELARLIDGCSVEIAVKTEPPGAAVYIKEYSVADEQWLYLGVTPIEKIRLPAGFFWWKIQKAGYETALAVVPTYQGLNQPYNIYRILDQSGTIPPGMVRVLGAKTDEGQLNDFFIDKYEVTNKHYKQFVESGGYRDRKYWKHKFIEAGRVLSWEEAMLEFVDESGQPGPSTWQGGDYPKGQDDYPVSGVSWYEAAAYAEYAGKILPTSSHWRVAAGYSTPLYTFSLVSRMSNFNGEGPAPVGSYRSMTAYGAYDMAGNVREWCWNETRDGRVTRGGAWNDATYMVGSVSQAPGFDRSPKNGFRCARYIDPGQVPAKALEPLAVAATDLYKLKPAPDSVFQVYKEQFAYDKKELKPHLEWRNQSSADWIQEKVTVDAAYGDEKLPMYLFLPKNSSPPYQTVIYFPGSNSAQPASSKDLEHYREFEAYLSFMVKNGRAVVYPIYKGTFERWGTAITFGGPTRGYTEFLIQLVKDFKTCVDYLETRPDIDNKKLAYFGFSWGAEVAPIILTADERVRASVLMVGGLRTNRRPETLELNYVTRVKVPTLMLNGRYDAIFPLETSAKPLFDLLGTPAAEKRQIVYDTDHYVPRNELIKESLAWFDRYLGRVKSR